MTCGSHCLVTAKSQVSRPGLGAFWHQLQRWLLDPVREPKAKFSEKRCGDDSCLVQSGHKVVSIFVFLVNHLRWSFPGGWHQFWLCLAELGIDGIEMIEHVASFYMFLWLFLAEPAVVNCCPKKVDVT